MSLFNFLGIGNAFADAVQTATTTPGVTPPHESDGQVSAHAPHADFIYSGFLFSVGQTANQTRQRPKKINRQYRCRR